MTTTPIPRTGDYCPRCCGHEHGPYDAQNRCVQCFNHEHTSARPRQGILVALGLVSPRIQSGKR
jgi:hypothetical protein